MDTVQTKPWKVPFSEKSPVSLSVYDNNTGTARRSHQLLAATSNGNLSFSNLVKSKKKTETICGADLKPQKWRFQWKMAKGATILLSRMKSWLLLILKYLVSSLFSNCGKPLFHLYLEVVPQVCTECPLSSCRCLSRVGRARVHLWSWWQTASCPLTAILLFSILLYWFGCTGS